MSVPDAVMDLPLDDIATCTRVSVCATEPANFAGIAAVTKGSAVIDAGDFTKANGDTSGRKISLTGLPEITATGAHGPGTAYLAFDNGSVLKKTVPVASLTLVIDEVWQVPATKLWEIKDPAYS